MVSDDETLVSFKMITMEENVMSSNLDLHAAGNESAQEV
jgi:hypothetical protein